MDSSTIYHSRFCEPSVNDYSRVFSLVTCGRMRFRQTMSPRKCATGAVTTQSCAEHKQTVFRATHLRSAVASRLSREMHLCTRFYVQNRVRACATVKRNFVTIICDRRNNCRNEWTHEHAKAYHISFSFSLSLSFLLPISVCHSSSLSLLHARYYIYITCMHIYTVYICLYAS